MLAPENLIEITAALREIRQYLLAPAGAPVLQDSTRSLQLIRR